MVKMHRLKLGSIKLPEVYVCRNQDAVNVCRDSGIPYIKWFHGTDAELILSIMLPALQKALPGIDWRRKIGYGYGRIKEVTVIVPPSPGYSVEEDEKWNVDSIDGEEPGPVGMAGDESEPVATDANMVPDEVRTDSSSTLRR